METAQKWCTPTVFIYESSQQSTPSQESYLIQRHLLTAVHVHAVMGAQEYTTSRSLHHKQREDILPETGMHQSDLGTELRKRG